MRILAALILLVHVVVGLLAAFGLGAERAIELGPTVYALPSGQHWFGTNALGQDLYARWMQACAGLVLVVLPGAGLGWAIGVALGVLAAHRPHGLVDYASARLVDAFEVVPGYLWLLFGAVAFRTHPAAGIGLLALCFWADSVRPVRQVGLATRRMAQFDAARVLGFGPWRLTLRHLLPQLGPILNAQFLLVLIGAIQAEALVSFLGLAPHARASLGGLLAEGGAALFAGQLWPMLLGSIALALPIFALGQLGLQDAERERRWW